MAENQYTDDKAFCIEWAKYVSNDYKFKINYYKYWIKPYKIAFYDYMKWDGRNIIWNCHDVSPGYGKDLSSAWHDLAMNIMVFENTSSKEETMVKVDLACRKEFGRGYGCQDYMSYYKL